MPSIGVSLNPSLTSHCRHGRSWYLYAACNISLAVIADEDCTKVRKEKNIELITRLVRSFPSRVHSFSVDVLSVPAAGENFFQLGFQVYLITRTTICLFPKAGSPFFVVGQTTHRSCAIDSITFHTLFSGSTFMQKHFFLENLNNLSGAKGRTNIKKILH